MVESIPKQILQVTVSIRYPFVETDRTINLAPCDQLRQNRARLCLWYVVLLNLKRLQQVRKILIDAAEQQPVCSRIFYQKRLGDVHVGFPAEHGTEDLSREALGVHRFNDH